MATNLQISARVRTYRQRFGPVLAGLAAIMLAACTPAEASPLAMVQAASHTTVMAETARISMVINGGAMDDVSFDGVLDLAAERIQLTLDPSELGIPGATGPIDTVLDYRDKAVQYIRFPGLADEFGGKHWVMIDLGAALKSACPDLDLTGLLQAQSGDPTSGLSMLEGAEKVTKLGDDVVRGVTTTHYKVILDLAKAAEAAPPAERAAMRKLAGMYKSTEQSADVWIDDEGRVRRLEQEIDFDALELPPCLQSTQPEETNPFDGAMSFAFEMYDFGAAPSVELPRAGDVVDAAKALGEL
jgi:hypothetical protein